MHTRIFPGNTVHYPDALWEGIPLQRDSGFLRTQYIDRYRGPRLSSHASVHSFWELTVVLSGSGLLHCRNRDIALGESLLVLVPPGCEHRESCTTMDTLWIGFDGRVMEKAVPEPLVIQDPVLTQAAVRLWLFAERRFGAIGFEMDGMLLALLGGLFRGQAEGTSHADADPVTQAIAWLHAHHDVSVALPQAAAAAGVSEGYFYRLFKKRTGMTPSHYLSKIRVEHAERMLRMTDAKVAEVAAACGVPDPFYFSRMFKRHTGLSPDAFRHRIRQ